MSITADKIEDRLADFTTDKRVLVLSVMALVIGVMSAVIAWVLVVLIGLITNITFYQRVATDLVSPDHNQLGVWMILIPVVGGLIIGLMARYGSEKIRGHGIPEALEAILIDRSRMNVQVAVLKPISSALSIGTGGPFGAEGPIIMTGGAFGSLFAQLFHLSPAERKTLLVAGAAGGMAAIFASPVAAVLIAVELLLFEWKPRSFIPVAIASAVAAALRVPLLGMGPIFPVPPHGALSAQVLVIAFGVGIIAGLASSLLTVLVYACEDLFNKLPIHWMWWPMLGGLAVGIAGLINPRVLGVGYDVIRDLLAGNIVGTALLTLLIIKALAWAIALGSGTSGGVLAPLIIMGGALGAIEAQWIPTGDVGLWVMLSMAAMMGGTMRAPLTAMVFTLELTHDLNALPALLLACIAAHGVTVLLMRRSILTEKVARHGHHLVREYTVDPLEAVRVADIMDRNVPTVPATMTVEEMTDRIARGDPQLSSRHGTPILNKDGQVVGMITRTDLVRAFQEGDGDKSVLEAGSKNLVVAYPDESLGQAVARMLGNDVGRLVVVSRRDPHYLVGYIGRSGIMRARLLRYQEEQSREQGWFVWRRNGGSKPGAPIEKGPAHT